MGEIYNSWNDLLEDFAQSLDLTPTQLNRAIAITTSVSNWISEREYKDGATIGVYTQGSMRLGTTVRPYRKEREKEYDVDVVAEIKKPNSEQQKNPKKVKFRVIRI